MMKIRTRNPAVGSANNSVSHKCQPEARYIRYQSPKKGSSELVICQQLFRRLECLYLATVRDQAAAALFGSDDITIVFPLIMPVVLCPHGRFLLEPSFLGAKPRGDKCLASGSATNMLLVPQRLGPHETMWESCSSTK